MENRSKLAESYLKNGYAIAPNVFSQHELNELRSEMIRIFDQEEKNSAWDSASVRTNPLERYPKLRKVFANGKILAALQDVLGEDSVVLWGGSIHDSSVSGGWHKDTNAMESAGNNFHYSPNCHLITMAIYFQSNHDEFGGGLDIVPGSQNRRETWWEKTRTSNRKIKYIFSHLDKRGLLPSWILHKRAGAISIPSIAGDVVFFNFKCDHRPTNARTKKIPIEHRKLALFISVAKNNEYLKQYLKFLKEVIPPGMQTTYSEEANSELKNYGLNIVHP